MNNKTKHQTTRVAKTYKLDKELVKEFKMLCEADGKSQASQIELLMNNYINTYNILFGKYDEGNVNISNSTFKNCYSNDGGEFIIIMVILIFLILNLKK